MMPSIAPLAAARLAHAKAAYTTCRIPAADAATLIGGPDVRPGVGDLVLAEVVRVGHHKAIETCHSRRATLFEGDEVLVVYGDRYAPDQFEAEISPDLRECHLVAAGGLASTVLSRHGTARAPTTLRPIGLVGDRKGARINLAHYALPPRQHPKTAGVIAVLGASMNAGKTTTAAALVRGLRDAGRRVAAAKVTGTGAGGDVWLMADSGAERVLDFTAAGVPSTYRLPFADVERVFLSLTNELMASGVDAIVLEVADGIYQRETSWLASSELFRSQVDGVLFAVRDALSASAGAAWLATRDLPLLGISGAISQSPLAVQEATEATGLAVFSPEDLAQGRTAAELVGPAPLLRRAA